ncbi:MAG: NADP-dependent oxidoreductase [Acidimicrobiales bacterium]
MRAIGLERWGGPEVLSVVELPDPVPGPGEVLVRVRAAAVNPTDTALRSGARADRLRDVPAPHVPGMDAAGEVAALGPATATDLSVGQAVMAVVVPHGPHGAYAELVAVPADSVVPIPAGASLAEAATLPMNGLTATMALDRLALRPGQTLGVTGAAGTLGGYVVELAKVDGLRVVADAAPGDEALVRRLGADVVVPRGPDVAERMRAAAPAGVDGLVDAAVQNALVAGAVRDGGQVATVRGYDADAERGVRLVPVWVREYARERSKLDRLRRLVEEGRLSLRVARTYPAAAAADAHRALEAGGVRGRLVLEW